MKKIFSIVLFISLFCSCEKDPKSPLNNLTCFDARDGKKYNQVTIGNQVWMAENLAYLPSVSPPYSGSNAEPYYYVYGYEGTIVSEAKATANYCTYGVLYNWPAATNGVSSGSNNPSGVQGICPDGWHLPSDAEWTELADYLGGDSVAGSKLKEAGTSHWYNPNKGATNSSGFSALPGGCRNIGSFNVIEKDGYWWSASAYDASRAWFRLLYYGNTYISRGYSKKEVGFSVRCVRD